MNALRRSSSLAVLLQLLAGLLLTVSPEALAQDSGVATPDQLRVRLTAMTPRVATDLSQSITISGEVTNISRRRIDDVIIRVQRAAKLTSSDRIAQAVAQPARNVAVNTEFTSVVNQLGAGGRAEFRLVVPLRGANSLQITEQGVYQLLVNVNGRPDGSAAARLAEADMLLPVLPADSGTQAAPPGVAPEPGTAMTMLWPIADRPRLIPTTGEKPLLTDDELADSLAPGGRLYNLLHILEQRVPPTAPLNSALCVAIDPDLVSTVTAMTRPYEVWSSSGRLAGRGSGAAVQWLGLLKTVVSGRCVIALPYAGTDLVASARAGLGDLVELAVTRDKIIQDAIGVQPVPVVWPRGGLLDRQALTELARLGAKALIVDPRSLANHDSTQTVAITEDGSQPQLAVKIDPLLTEALSSTVSAHTAGLSTQDVIGALAFRTAIQRDQPPPGGTTVIAPPATWSVAAPELIEFLDATRYLLESGRARPRSLIDLVSGVTHAAEVTTAYPVTAGAAEIPNEVTAKAATDRAVLNDLGAAMRVEQARGIDPATVLEPYRLGLLRAMSTYVSASPGRMTVSGETVRNQIDELRGQVKVVQPGTVYSLASSDSPLPLTVSNGLPVAIDVRVELAGAQGIRVKPIPTKTIPAQGTLPLLLPAEVVRSGSFTINASVRTPGGTELGANSPSRLRLRSTAYGTVTLVLTIVAFAVLVGLSLFRIVRRVRSSGRDEKPSDIRARDEDGNCRSAGDDEPPGSEADHPGSGRRAKLSTLEDESGTEDRTPV